jgi:plasmid stabilization system protein ParE
MTKSVGTRHPQSDVDAIFHYITNESHSYALRTIESIESAASAAARMPESGGIVSEFSDSSIREVLAERYRIIYRVRNNLPGKIVKHPGTHRPARCPEPDGLT